MAFGIDVHLLRMYDGTSTRQSPYQSHTVDHSYFYFVNVIGLVGFCEVAAFGRTFWTVVLFPVEGLQCC